MMPPDNAERFARNHPDKLVETAGDPGFANLDLVLARSVHARLNRRGCAASPIRARSALAHQR